ncbi:MAG: AIR synthase related protein, partial [Oligoflexia bacterium]|nr:AIR synthase related protein [Oligoflexia bacterium]
MVSIKQNKYQLSERDHKRLKSLLGREPNTLEIVLALALWNEHCSYRSSKKHLKKFQFPTQKKISGLGEQAGVVDLGQGEKICFKMESHNHPSYIIPYHGAATAVGGILRDIFAMNARPIALADFLCFADTSKEDDLSVKEEHAYRVSDVVRGIGDYGNCIGVPTITGQTEFSDSYSGNILVNAMALGYLGSQSQVISSQAKGVGHYVVYVGSATGRDGILGADMASQS